MHVSSIKKNLISVSKFSKDNNVFFEFYLNFCHVKSLDSKKIVLQGHIKDGLYVFDSVVVAKSPTMSPLVFIPNTLL